MTVTVKPGAALAQVSGPVVETERLILRTWRASDVTPNSVMLSDPGTAQFITPDRKPVNGDAIPLVDEKLIAPAPLRRADEKIAQGLDEGGAEHREGRD